MRDIRTLLWLTVSASLLLAPSGAAAASVANTNDAGPGSLRQTVLDAAPGETVSVPAGTYTLTSGELAIEKGLTLAGAGAASTIVRAGGAFRVIHVKAAAKTEVAFSGLTIRDGRLLSTIAQGGGVWVEGANLTLDRVVVADNLAKGVIAEGGGVGVRTAGAAMTLRDSVFSGNVADASGTEAAKSGGIAEGGGLYSRESGTVTIERSTFTANRSLSRGNQGPPSAMQAGGIAQAGGIYVDNENPNLLLTSTLSGNVADASPGPGASGGLASAGGLYLRVEKATARVTELTLTGNSVLGGSSASGGGIQAGVSTTGQIPIVSSTLVANAVSATTASGGNLSSGPGVTIANSVISAGAGPAGSENCSSVGGTSLGTNLESLDQCGFHAAGDRINTNPQLGPLQDNGGPTATMLPASTSPLVDQGTSLGLTADQRGLPRPIDFVSIPNPALPGADGSDVGATELQPPTTIALGKLTKNRKRGTALLTVSLPSLNLGTLTLSGKGLKTRTTALTGATEVTFAVATKKGKARKALFKRGKRKIGINVTYAPTAALSSSLSRKATLVRKLKHHRKAR